MLTSAMTTRRVNAGAGNHENIFGAPGFVLSRAIARPLAASRHALYKPLIYKIFLPCQRAVTWHHCREAGCSARG